MKIIYTLILGFLILFNISCQKEETIQPIVQQPQPQSTLKNWKCTSDIIGETGHPEFGGYFSWTFQSQRQDIFWVYTDSIGQLEVEQTKSGTVYISSIYRETTTCNCE